MTRVFTKDIGRWKKGEIREYPVPTWQQIERGAKVKLSSFSKEIEDAVRGVSLETPDNQKPISRRT